MENKKRFRSLSRRADFLALRAKGTSFHIGVWLLVNMRKTDLQQIRCGWTIPRQVGTAVVRNRFKRWGREYLRKWALKNQGSLDLNLIFKRREKDFYKSVSHGEFDEVMDKLAAKLERHT